MFVAKTVSFSVDSSMFKSLFSLLGGEKQKFSRVELFFLSKFDEPTNPAEISGYLKATLQQEPDNATKKFLGGGLIESATELK